MVMIRKFILGLAFAGILLGCNKKKEVALQQEIDSLRTELQESRQTAQTLQEVGAMIDSIDASYCARTWWKVRPIRTTKIVWPVSVNT